MVDIFFEPSFVLGAGKGRLIDYCSCSIQDDIAIMIEEDSIVGGGNHQYISRKKRFSFGLLQEAEVS